QSIVGLGRSVLDIPAPVHREQVRQLGDERLPTPGDIMDLPEIPPLLSTRQKRHGLPPCFSAEWPSADLPRHSRPTATGVLKRFVWTPYMAPQWCAIELAWVNEVGEIMTWLATVPIVLFIYVRFHHVDRVKRQFSSEQPVPLDPVNLDRFLRASARGDDRWWPNELAYWYGFWSNRRSRDHQIQIVPTCHPGWPTMEYTDWWAVACRQRFLTQDRLLQDPRGVQLPGDVPPASSQERDPIVLPRDAPARERRAWMQRPNIQWKGEGASSSGRVDSQPGEDDEDEEAEYDQQEDIPEGDGDQDPGGDGPASHDPDIDFFSDRVMEYGGASGSGSRPNPPPGGDRCIVTARRVTCTSCFRAGSRRWIRSHMVIWRLAPPMMRFTGRARLCSLTLPNPSSVRGFSTTSPRSSCSFTHHRSSSISYACPIARRTTSHHCSRPISHLHGLSNITSPPSAITHRPRSPSTTIRCTRLSAHGHNGHRGIAIRPLRHIIPSPPLPDARGRPGLGSGACMS
ncbi:hypothetical protein PIB30_069038, partial [Stylosanthes scabra]|nr:hypothetical protein [Stylosanthes scabra]